MVPGTSNQWPYYNDLVFFCLKFRVAQCTCLWVCEHLKYYYNTTNDYWNIPGKIKAGGFEDILFCKKKKKKKKNGFTLASSVKLCYPLWKFQGKKWRPMEIQHIFSISMKILYIYNIYCFILLYWQEVAFETIALWNLLRSFCL